MKKTNATNIILLVIVFAIMVTLLAVPVSAATTYATDYYTYTSGTVYYTSPVMKGTSAVKYYQRAINYCIVNKGLNTAKLECDSSFGPACEKACIAFQKWANSTYCYSLSVDGSFGPKSREAMAAILNGTAKRRTTTTASTESKWLWPSSSRRLTCAFADSYYHSSHWHRGIDIACSNGSNVYASKSGTIAYVGSDGSRGKYVIIDHGNGYYSEYQHLSTVLKSKGNKVTQGTVIAKSGDTGSAGSYHLHFEIWNLGKSGKSISSADVPWNTWSQYVNVDPKNSDKVYCTSGSGFTIGQKQGSGIAAASLKKTSKSAGSGLLYCTDSYGIEYIFK